MLVGLVRDNFPLLRLELPAVDGDVTVEFVVDTGFDGHLALPRRLTAILAAEDMGHKTFALADRSLSQYRVFEMLLDWHDEEVPVEVVEMEGNPLLGMRLLNGSLLQVEAKDGGEVAIEPM